MNVGCWMQDQVIKDCMKFPLLTHLGKQGCRLSWGFMNSGQAAPLLPCFIPWHSCPASGRQPLAHGRHGELSCVASCSQHKWTLLPSALAAYHNDVLVGGILARAETLVRHTTPTVPDAQSIHPAAEGLLPNAFSRSSLQPSGPRVYVASLAVSGC